MLGRRVIFHTSRVRILDTLGVLRQAKALKFAGSRVDRCLLVYGLDSVAIVEMQIDVQRTFASQDSIYRLRAWLTRASNSLAIFSPDSMVRSSAFGLSNEFHSKLTFMY